MAWTTAGCGATNAATLDAATLDEPTLLRCVAQGDATAFWPLWDLYLHGQLLQHSLRWMDGNHADAEDALSSAGIKAWQYLDAHPREIAHVKAWLTKLLYNHCMNLRKANQKRSLYDPLAASSERLDAGAASAAPAHPEAAALRREMRLYVRRHVNRLPPPLREPLVLHFFEHLSQREVAARLNLSYDVVRKRLQHARMMLHDWMTPYLEHGDGGAASMSIEVVEDIASQPAPVDEDIASQVVAIRMAPIVTTAGVEAYATLMLDHKPTRQAQKAATLRAYVQRYPGGWRKRLQLADLLYAMGRWEEAIALFHNVLQRQPGQLHARLRLGRMLRLLRRESEAIEVYEDALAVSDSAAAQDYLRGCIALCHGGWDEAAQAYAAAAAREPDCAVYQRELGLTWLRAGCPTKALQVFDQLLQAHPDDLAALTFSYDPLMAVGRVETAAWRTARARQLDPGNTLALAQWIDYRCRMGHVRGTEGRETKALLRRAVQLAPDAPPVQAAQLHVHLVRGEQEAGLALWRQMHDASCPAGDVTRLTLDIARRAWDYVRAKTVSMT